MEREGFVFYRSFYEALECLGDKEAYECFKAIALYALDGVEVEMTGIVKALFLTIKPQIDANNQRYANGCKGGRPSKTKQKPNENQTETKVEPKEKEKDKEKDKEKVKEKDKEKVKKKNTLSLYEGVRHNYPLSPNMDLTLVDWFTYRDSIHKPLGEKSVIKLIEKVIALERQYGYSAVAKCFNTSIAQGYQGVFFDKITNGPPIRDNKSDVDDWFRKELSG